MFVFCTASDENKVPVFLVFEPLSERNSLFWNKYLNEISFQAGAPSSGPSNLQEAVKGFRLALNLPPKDDTIKYVAYSTFAPNTIGIDDEWKALNIQMCMTVTGHLGLPFTTHMGIFASPFRIATELPANYKQLEQKLGGKSPLEYFAKNKADKISLLLHSFAVQAYAVLNKKNAPLFMVTKPIASMAKIFAYVPACLAQSEKCDTNIGDLVDGMKNTSHPVGYHVEIGSSTVHIVVRMPDFSLAQYEIKLIASGSSSRGPTTSSSRVASAVSTTASSSRLVATPRPGAMTASRGTSVGAAHRTVTPMTAHGVGSAAATPVSMTSSSSSSPVASAIHPATVTPSGSDRFASIHPASIMVTSDSGSASDIHPASRPPNKATTCRAPIKVTATFLYELAFNPSHHAATVFIDALALSDLYALGLSVNGAEPAAGNPVRAFRKL